MPLLFVVIADGDVTVLGMIAVLAYLQDVPLGWQHVLGDGAEADDIEQADGGGQVLLPRSAQELDVRVAVARYSCARQIELLVAEVDPDDLGLREHPGQDDC